MEHSNFSIISYSAHVHVKTGVCQLGFISVYVCFEIVKNMVPVAMFIHVLGIKIKLLNLMP